MQCVIILIKGIIISNILVTIKQKKENRWRGLVTHTYNLITQGPEAGGCQVKCQYELLCETVFKTWNTKINETRKVLKKRWHYHITPYLVENSYIYCICPFSWPPLREAGSQSCVCLLRIMLKLRGASRNVKIRIEIFLSRSQLSAIFSASFGKGSLRITSLCWTHLSVASTIKIIWANSLAYLKIMEEIVDPIRSPRITDLLSCW